MRQSKVNINGIKAVIHECGENFIICSHGLYSNKESKKYVEMARKACSIGLSCVRFDFRGCGESEGKFEDSILSNRIRDLDEVVNYIRRNYGGKIALLGSSFGGMVAIVYAYMNMIKPVVLISTPYMIKDIENRFIEDARKYNLIEMASTLSHVFIIHGKKDEIVPLHHAEKLYTVAREPKKLLVLETDHSLSNNEERLKAINEAINWITSYI